MYRGERNSEDRGYGNTDEKKKEKRIQRTEIESNRRETGKENLL